MTLSNLIRANPDSQSLQEWLKKVPYAAYLGISAEVSGNDIVFLLPANERLIGNPTLPAVHGGVIGAFMEQAAAFHLVANMTEPALPKIIDFSLDYLRPARLQNTFAQCILSRQGRSIANLSVTAWQENPAQPCAVARAHFLLPERRD